MDFFTAGNVQMFRENGHRMLWGEMSMDLLGDGNFSHGKCSAESQGELSGVNVCITTQHYNCHVIVTISATLVNAHTDIQTPFECLYMTSSAR